MNILVTASVKVFSLACIAFSSLLLANPAWSWSDSTQLNATAEPMRLLRLPVGADPDRWARQQGLDNWQLRQNSRGEQWISSRIGDQQWRQRQAACLGSDCQSDSCQSIRNITLPTQRRGWLVPRAPDLTRALNGEAALCPAAQQTQPWRGEWPKGSEAACWQLQLSHPCQSEQTPAEYLKEQWQPDQILMLLRQGAEPNDKLAGRLGLQLLEAYTLDSTGDRLLRLQRPPQAVPLQNLIDQLSNDPMIALVQKDLAYFTLGSHSASDDPLAGFNYGPQLSTAERLVSQFSGREVKVAVIDTGIDAQHPELAGRVGKQRDFTDRGYSADPHGTAVAAIIAGARNNGVGAAGVAPQATIMAYKACHPRLPGMQQSRCWSRSLIRALDSAISDNISLINLSLGGPPSPILQRLVAEAERRGLLLVAAAGNGGGNARPVYPAAWPQTLAVTALGADRQLYRMANRGDYVQLAAPGVDIITAGPGGTQPVLSGTSMASAHISGIAAQLKQMAPQLPLAELKTRLLQSAEDLGATGTDSMFGRGLVNACRSAAGLGQLPAGCADQLSARGGQSQ
ncbi:S8 family peptidase [Marinobacterium jannaschii]|uniref:S8 family peptidase n=1 Tax=Marinobacterium jannaschii TaxID=64970 RepID=UPI0006845D85|nr:S8 family serine peptidase [Marinobacterium jannaschii]